MEKSHINITYLPNYNNSNKTHICSIQMYYNKIDINGHLYGSTTCGNPENINISDIVYSNFTVDYKNNDYKKKKKKKKNKFLGVPSFATCTVGMPISPLPTTLHKSKSVWRPS